MKLIFEKSKAGLSCSVLPPCDVPAAPLPAELARKTPARLPCLDENRISRHYSALAKRVFGVNDGFYPLGSCTMKYNPKLNEELAALAGFTGIHPLQPDHTVEGCKKVFDLAAQYLCEIAGMDAVNFQPAAGAHGEFTGLLLFRAYHESRGDAGRTKIIIPDSAHGTNPASATMAGFSVVNIASGPDGCVDLGALAAAAGPDTAGLMLTNPNTAGLFDPKILEITRIVHEAGGLNYYDGANLNAIMGIARPGDMGFDMIHFNLHKSFSTPHGGGGPGSGAVSCKSFLAPFLPVSGTCLAGKPSDSSRAMPPPEAGAQSIGRVRAFHGNFLVVVKALAYLLYLGKEGIPQAARNAVLNANYLMEKLRDKLPPAYPGPCMHEFVISLEKIKASYHVSALDFAKALQDRGMHPPTIYFPLTVREALMVEPTETESRETLDEAADAFLSVYDEILAGGGSVRAAPVSTVIRRPDEVQAARKPVPRYVAP
ncbi:MAG: aminomethyl-transferring glycine dehydrogenase subunit GcvPB [Spirochaetaceae bacterium]|jgi:glycine dehydrogenase subunit 2|nr:aminomethyl-transferring glycine dehydrogenase subunit GcvPB [Spirochaetaceae bacterium]